MAFASHSGVPRGAPGEARREDLNEPRQLRSYLLGLTCDHDPDATLRKTTNCHRGDSRLPIKNPAQLVATQRYGSARRSWSRLGARLDSMMSSNEATLMTSPSAIPCSAAGAPRRTRARSPASDDD
jgi:hypothetical protein